MRNLTDSTYGNYERFKWGMHAKQERVDRLNCFNDKVFLIPVYLSFCNQISCFISGSGACFDAMLFAISTSYSQSNESIGWGSTGSCVYRRKSRVYEQYTQQDHPMGNTEKILQYYKKWYLHSNFADCCQCGNLYHLHLISCLSQHFFQHFNKLCQHFWFCKKAGIITSNFITFRHLVLSD